MAKVRQEELYTCSICGALYECDSSTTPWDCLGNLSCDTCYQKNMEKYGEFWERYKEPEEFTTPDGFVFKRLPTGEYTDGDITFTSWLDLMQHLSG